MRKQILALDGGHRCIFLLLVKNSLPIESSSILCRRRRCTPFTDKGLQHWWQLHVRPHPTTWLRWGRKQNKSDPPLSLAAYMEFPSPFLSHPTAALSRTWFPSRSHSPLPLLLINLHASHVILNPASYPANLLTQLQMQRVPLKKNQCFFLGDNTLKTSQISSEELFCHFF